MYMMSAPSKKPKSRPTRNQKLLTPLLLVLLLLPPLLARVDEGDSGAALGVRENDAPMLRVTVAVPDRESVAGALFVLDGVGCEELVAALVLDGVTGALTVAVSDGVFVGLTDGASVAEGDTDAPSLGVCEGVEESDAVALGVRVLDGVSGGVTVPDAVGDALFVLDSDATTDLLTVADEETRDCETLAVGVVEAVRLVVAE